MIIARLDGCRGGSSWNPIKNAPQSPSFQTRIVPLKRENAENENMTLIPLPEVRYKGNDIERLERLGDHAVNLAGDVLIITGDA